MKHTALVALTLACVNCQTIPQDAEGKGSGKSSPTSHEIVVDINSFYKDGIHPKVRLQEHEATEVRAIIKSAPEVDLEPIPLGWTISPAPGLSVIEDGDDAYHIMPDCEIAGRRIPLQGRMRLFRILSKHTSHFEEPKA